MKSKKKIIKLLIISSLALLNLAPLTPSLAASDFNPNFLISDSDLLNSNSLGLEGIQKFLETNGGALANYIDPVTRRRASEIIWQSAQSYGINPQVLLTLIQKEQSLVTDPSPNENQYRWATGFALCDSCSTLDPQVAIFGGFNNQVDRAAWWLRSYLDATKTAASSWLKQPGQTYQIDSYLVAPFNLATAALYSYTPHYYGNYNFWRIWNNWFALAYPDGSLLRPKGGGDIWLIENGKRRLFQSIIALRSRFDTKKIIEVDPSELERYEIDQPIKFAQYSLVRSPKGTVYLLVNDERRGITSREVFRTIGFNWQEVQAISFSELNNYREGQPITLKNAYPLGALLQNRKTGGIYYVENGQKHPIYSKEILLANFKNRNIVRVSPDELDKYSTQEPVKFNDGELVMGSSNIVYVISRGERHAIASKEIFDKLGYKWENVIKTTDQALEIQPLGSPINYLPEQVQAAIQS